MGEKTIKKIQRNKIFTEADTQMCISFDEETVEEYAEDMKNGNEFPNLIVFYGNGKYYFTDSKRPNAPRNDLFLAM